MSRLATNFIRAVSFSASGAVFPFSCWEKVPRNGGCGPIAPARAARRTITVEERLQKLAGMNQRLLEQNQQLTHELKTVTQKVNAPDRPGVQRRLIPVVQPPAGGANVLRSEPMTGSAYGGGELMAAPSGPAPPAPAPVPTSLGVSRACRPPKAAPISSPSTKRKKTSKA